MKRLIVEPKIPGSTPSRQQASSRSAGLPRLSWEPQPLPGFNRPLRLRPRSLDSRSLLGIQQGAGFSGGGVLLSLRFLSSAGLSPSSPLPRPSRRGGWAECQEPKEQAGRRQDAARPEADVQRLPHHFLVHVEERRAGRDPLQQLHGPFRAARRWGSLLRQHLRGLAAQ